MLRFELRTEDFCIVLKHMPFSLSPSKLKRLVLAPELWSLVLHLWERHNRPLHLSDVNDRREVRSRQS